MISTNHVYDAIIVGAGPAGISCALECAESALDVIVLDREDRIGGQLSLIPGPLQNFAAGFYTTGDELQKQMEKVASIALFNHLTTGLNVQSFNLQERTLETSQGKLHARTIFLATGYRSRELDSSLHKRFESDVLYHSGAFKNELRNKSLVVLGGGDSAMFTALDMAEVCADIKVLVRSSNLKARPDVMARVNSEPRIKVLLNTKLTELNGRDHLESVIATAQGTEQELPCDKLIVKLGYVPNTELFRDQLECDEIGHVIVDQGFATSIEGVFAGGDIVRPGYDRIAFAAGSGMMAAKAMRKAIGHNV